MIFEGGERMSMLQSVSGELISEGGKSLKVTYVSCGELFTSSMACFQPGFHAWVRDLSSALPLCLFSL
jgi:hypothetical protein